MKNKNTHVDNNTLNEIATRRQLISDCVRRFGPEGGRQLKALFIKWDKLIVDCKNENESKISEEITIKVFYYNSYIFLHLFAY